MNGIRLHYVNRAGEPVTQDVEAEPDGLAVWTAPEDCDGMITIEHLYPLGSGGTGVRIVPKSALADRVQQVVAPALPVKNVSR